jgi:Cu/Ag efflux pump CusA
MTRYSLAPTDIFDALNGQNTEAGRASAPRRRSRTSSSAQHPLEGLKASFPQRIDQKITYDTTVFVTDSIREVVKTPFDASGLVVIVASSAITTIVGGMLTARPSTSPFPHADARTPRDAMPV